MPVEKKPTSELEATIRQAEPHHTLSLPGGRLVVEAGPDAGRTAPLTADRLLIGRAAGNQLALSRDAAASATHCELLVGPDGVRLRDLGSTNGIHLFGHRVKELWLHDGSSFTVGASRIRFEAAAGTTVELPLSLEEEFGELYGRSLPMRQIFALLERVAPLDLTVLISGETGTGKELVARSLHEMSLRAGRPFLVLDCGSIPRELIESTLFGHERGAFTGAQSAHAGIFEETAGGTLFLDEIGDMDLDLQRRLLRVLERREVVRVGTARPIPVDVRLVAATHRDLREAMNRGTFREDLYFRLAQVPIELPPLRDRRDDIPGLAERFLAEASRWLERPPQAIGEDARQALLEHRWPGNVRELRNVIHRAASLATAAELSSRDLLLRARDPVERELCAELPFKEAKAQVVERFERAYLEALVSRHSGNLTHAARQAGVARNHLRDLLRQHGIAYKAEP